MRLLVGTLYTGENEFDACCASIRSQSHVDFEHVVIRDLPNKEAHETLYGLFMDRSDEFDLLVKVDADMVIRDPDLFRGIVTRFQEEADLDLLLIAVHDFFTDELIIGLNVSRNTVRWDLGEEALFTDMTYDRSTVRRTVKDYDTLAPAAFHCPGPSDFQAFHFGFHRGMKAVRGGKRWEVLESLYEHFRRNDDHRLALAMLGANLAFEPRFSVDHISYNDHTLASHFHRRFGGQPPEALRRAVRGSKLYWLFRLPIDRRLLKRYYRMRWGAT